MLQPARYAVTPETAQKLARTALANETSSALRTLYASEVDSTDITPEQLNRTAHELRRTHGYVVVEFHFIPKFPE